MSKNRTGSVTAGNLEWGRKARKHEDELRGRNNTARREAVEEQLNWWAEAEAARWDDDPNPYHGDYSEE